MKKLISLFAVAALGALLVGCSGDAASTDTAATTGTTAAAPATTGDTATK